MHVLMSDRSVSVTELKKSPAAVLRQAEGRAVAVLNHNRPEAYLVPAAPYRLPVGSRGERYDGYGDRGDGRSSRWCLWGLIEFLTNASTDLHHKFVSDSAKLAVQSHRKTIACSAKSVSNPPKDNRPVPVIDRPLVFPWLDGELRRGPQIYRCT